MRGMHPLSASVILLILGAATAVQAQSTMIRGVEYREITDLGQPRTTRAQPQLGSAPLGSTQMGSTQVVSNPRVASVTPRYAQYAPPVNPPRNVVWPATVPTVADQRPSLNGFGGSMPANVASYNRPYAYGYGHANGCSWANNQGYANTMPPMNQAAAFNTVPVSNIQPLGAMQPPPNAGWGFNPYQGSQNSVPWKPLVPIRSMPTNYEIGQGIIGQPKIYVPDQPLRNMIRYITP